MDRFNTASLDTASDIWSASPKQGGSGFKKRGKGSKRTSPTDTAGTPWCENVNGLKLSEEIGCFVRFFQPTCTEKSARENVEACVASCMRKICPSSTVKRVGAYSYGMGRYDAPLELVIEVDEVNSDLAGFLCTELLACGYSVQQPLQSATTIVAVAPSTACEPVKVEVSIVEGWRVHTRKRSRCLAKLLSKSSSHKAAGQAAFVIASILSKSFKSLTTDVLTVMALAHLTQTRKPTSARDMPSSSSRDSSSEDGSSVSSDHTEAASFFRSFLCFLSSDEFCTVNDNRGCVFDVQAGVERTDEPGLFVRCPIDPTINLAADCDASVAFRLKITAVSSYQQITQTEAALSRTQLVRATDTRTPLSSVCAYHSFWLRKFSMEATRNSPPSTPSSLSDVLN